MDFYSGSKRKATLRGGGWGGWQSAKLKGFLVSLENGFTIAKLSGGRKFQK